jgi:transmembrane sensor
VAEERSQALAAAAEHIDSEFAAPRIERGVAQLERRIARRTAVRRGLSVTAACSVLLLGLWLGRDQTRSNDAARSAGALRLDTQDGSEARGLDGESALLLERDAPEEVSLALVRGKGHFEVKPNKKRRYHVRAGDVEVEVLGTAFVVERLRERARQRARVHVEHGVVKVSWPGGSTTLRAGEQGVFPPAPEQMKPVALPEPQARASEPAAQAPVSASEPVERWRSLARAGKHKEAFRSIGARSIDDLSGLLLAADAARLSGHPREAVDYLERVIARYPRSASAHVSAFTLGRLALYELNQPALAARSFARAYELDREGPLAEDALAREAEAYHRAGDGERAERAAERYLARYPKGARRAELLRYTRSGAAAGP